MGKSVHIENKGPTSLEEFELILEIQKGKKFSDHGPILPSGKKFRNRGWMVSKFVRAHIAEAKRLRIRPKVTPKMVVEMLHRLDRGYVDSLARASVDLQYFYEKGLLERYSEKSFRVSANGKVYRSIREAAKAEGVAPNTVRKRVKSKSNQFAGWRYTDR